MALQRILRLETERQAKGMYSDLAGADSAVSAAADAFTAAGYMQGYPGGLFKPDGGLPVLSWRSWQIHWCRSSAPQPGK